MKLDPGVNLKFLGAWSETPVHMAGSPSLPPPDCPRAGSLTQSRIRTLLVLLWSAVRGVPCSREKTVM